jgi:hypothetical protein
VNLLHDRLLDQPHEGDHLLAVDVRLEGFLAPALRVRQFAAQLDPFLDLGPVLVVGLLQL